MATQTLVLSSPASTPFSTPSSSTTILTPSSSGSILTPSSASSSASPEAPERRRCWECLRRRLVCDATRPVCNKCRASGIVCPGYDDKKPLTWLAPGKVTCRTRRKPRQDNKNQKTVKGIVVKTPPKDEGSEFFSSNIFNGVINDIKCISHSPLRTDVCDVYDAARYYNAVFYPYANAGQKSGSNVFVEEIPMDSVRLLPAAIAHNMVSIVFQHRLCAQTQWKVDCPSAKHAEARLHHHRGIAIRALNEDIANEKTQSNDVVLTGVILLLHAEIQSCISPNWRHHVNGLLAMLSCRGGALGWVSQVPQLKGVLLSFLISATMANTTSPSFDHVKIAPHEELMELAKDLYPIGLHPSMPCPMALFLEIIRINHLRYQVSNGFIDKEIARGIAEDIIKRIEAFEANEWDGFYENPEHNKMIGLMFQSAVAVFCLSSLQSISVLPCSNRMTVLRTIHGDRLYLRLEESQGYRVLQKSVLWPLIVAGVEAGARVDKRQLVEAPFMGQSQVIGTPLPMYAKAMLRRYWDGDDADWDSCFDKPYALISWT